MTHIIKVMDEQEILDTFPVMQELRSHLTQDTYLATIRRLQQRYHYHLATIIDQGKVKCVAGYHLAESLHRGPYLYIDDLVTVNQERSKSYGKKMLDWFVAEARSLGCQEIHLDSGIQRHEAHRFYLRERLAIVAYHFSKKTV